MSLNILIISPKLLKERTALHDNVDEKLIYPEIKAVQDLYLLPLLGTALFNKIIGDIGTATLADPYKTLVDQYLIDMICNYVMSEMPESINYQLTNRGAVSKSTDKETTPSISDMLSIVSKYKNRAEHYYKRAQMYLLQNGPTLFLEYLNPGFHIDDVRPDRHSFSTPIYLGDEVRHYRSFEDKYQGNRPDCDYC